MSKYSAKIIAQICQEYLSGKYSHEDICLKYEIHYNQKKKSSIIYDWIPRYLSNGEQTFIRAPGYAAYTSAFKKKAVIDYLNGNGSLREIAAKYNIPSKEALRRWVMLYNANRELKDYNPNREVYMAEAKRKTTIDERKEIVEYCINHNRNYKDTAAKHDVSYSQVYSWVKKYDINGVEALTDKRGRHKSDDEVDELERLRRENIRLKRQLKENDMLTELLKKVQEFERM